MKKPFRLAATDIRPIAIGYGSCFASDHIAVEGQKVGFMYRQEPDNEFDSGWRFLSGTESQEYLDDPHHLAIYDVNTIANYDEGIVEHIDAAIGSAFARLDGGGFVEEVAPDHPDA